MLVTYPQEQLGFALPPLRSAFAPLHCYPSAQPSAAMLIAAQKFWLLHIVTDV